MQNCPRCRNQLSYVDRYNQWYCHNCQAYQQPLQQSYQPPQYPQQPNQPISKQYKTAPILITIIVIIVVILILILSLRSLVGPETPNNGNEFTAFQGLDIAEDLARDWESDAKLTGIWTWEGPPPSGADDFAANIGTTSLKGDGKNTFWLYDFRSGTIGVELWSLIVILYMDGTYELRERGGGHFPTVSNFFMDSDEVIIQFKNIYEDWYPDDSIIIDPEVTVEYRFQYHSEGETKWWLRIKDYSANTRYFTRTIASDDSR